MSWLGLELNVEVTQSQSALREERWWWMSWLRLELKIFEGDWQIRPDCLVSSSSIVQVDKDTNLGRSDAPNA